MRIFGGLSSRFLSFLLCLLLLAFLAFRFAWPSFLPLLRLFLFTIFLDFYDFLMILTASHSFRHVTCYCCHAPARPLSLILLPSLSRSLFCFRFRARATHNFSNFLRLFVYVSTVFVGFSLGWVWVGSGEVEFAGRGVEEAGFGFACNSQHPLPSSSPHHYSFCLLLMRLFTLINVFFFLSFPTTLPVTFASCFTSAKGEGGDWIWVSVSI